MHACKGPNSGIATDFSDGKDYLATYKSARSSVQLQKAAKDVCLVLERFLGCDSTSDQKLKTAYFIEAFNAAYESLSGASHDQTRLLAALRTAKLALRGLKQCRGVIKGRTFEVEIQQYSLIRRLVALKAFTEVLICHAISKG